MVRSTWRPQPGPGRLAGRWQRGAKFWLTVLTERQARGARNSPSAALTGSRDCRSQSRLPVHGPRSRRARCTKSGPACATPPCRPRSSASGSVTPAHGSAAGISPAQAPSTPPRGSCTPPPGSSRRFRTQCAAASVARCDRPPTSAYLPPPPRPSPAPPSGRP